MRRQTRLRTLALIVWAATFVSSAPASTSQPAGQSPALRIVVVEGEDGVNIIQQKTAVAPVIEVRDRNDQPVAGAIVNFAIRGGRATFGGAQTLTVTTNAVGQAVATGLTPTASGALQISATAAFQGQTAAAVTIAQTNVMTAAQAAAVSSAAGTSGGGASGAGAGGASGGSSGSAAGTGAAGGAGGGGGLSATTIGIIGGAVAGGAVAATQLAGGASGEQAYSGPFAMIWGVGCLVQQMTGTIVVEFVASSDAPGTTISNGNLSLKDTTSNVVSRPANCAVLSNGNWGMPDAGVTGTVDNFEAHGQDRVTSLIGTPLDRNYDFRGALSNGVVSGTFSLTWRDANPPNAQTSGTSSVTLSRVQQ